MGLFLLITYSLLLLAIGSCCLFFPKNVQLFAKRVASIGLASKSQWLKTFIQSNSYIINVRAVGVIAYVMAILVALAVYQGS